MRLLAIAAIAAISLTACGDDEPGPLARLGPAACADLDNGMTVMQVANSGIRNGMDRKEVAAAIVLGIEDHCPEYKPALAATPIANWL